jgi:hypothetical protein
MNITFAILIPDIKIKKMGYFYTKLFEFQLIRL